MDNPWNWSRRSNERAIDNARRAATELSRMLVERQEIDHFLAELAGRRTRTRRPA